MKKILSVLLVFSLLFLINGCQKAEVCESDNEALCEILEINDFEIEENAKIKIGVFNEAFVKNFISEIESLYPNLVDVFEYEIISNNQLDIEGFDIIQSKVENVPLLFNNLEVLDESFYSLLNNEVINKFSKAVNQSEMYFMPFDYEGLLFAYNKTMLEAFNVDLSDEDNNGLADEIDSFEKISELAKTWRKDKVLYNDDEISEIFSFPLNDQLAMLAFFENSNYKLINGNKAEDMDVNDNLLNALSELFNLGLSKWYFDDTKDNDMIWNYEEVLLNQSAPFMLVGNWMFYEEYQQSQAYNLVFSKLPTLNEENLQTLSSVSGFVINKDSKYLNAANLFIKLLKSEVGVDSELLEVFDFEIDANIKEQIKAYSYSSIMDLHAFESNPNILGFNVYYEIDFRNIFKDVFLNKISPQDAQIKIIEKLISYYKDNDLSLEYLESQFELIKKSINDTK